MTSQIAREERGVLLFGATGRTGGHVLTQLLARGVPVRAIVRYAERLPVDAAGNPLITVVEAELSSMSPEALRRHVVGRGAVIACLGHSRNLRGVFGPPRDLVEGAARSVCEAIEALRPDAPTRSSSGSWCGRTRSSRASRPPTERTTGS